MDNVIREQVKNIMSVVFTIPVDEIDENSSSDSIHSWDSINHMKLVVALEEEFNIEFKDAEIIELINTKLIVLVLSEKL